MVEDYKKVKDLSGDARVELAKKTVMVFPGVTKAFIDVATAKEYLSDPLDAGAEKLMKVLFKIAVDLQGDLRPFSKDLRSKSNLIQLKIKMETTSQMLKKSPMK